MSGRKLTSELPTETVLLFLLHLVIIWLIGEWNSGGKIQNTKNGLVRSSCKRHNAIGK